MNDDRTVFLDAMLSRPVVCSCNSDADEGHESMAHRASEALAAELTAAAYPVALRHGVGGKWLDLELDLWRVLAETVQRWERRIAPAVSPPKSELSQDRRRSYYDRVSPRHAW